MSSLKEMHWYDQSQPYAPRRTPYLDQALTESVKRASRKKITWVPPSVSRARNLSSECVCSFGTLMVSQVRFHKQAAIRSSSSSAALRPRMAFNSLGGSARFIKLGKSLGQIIVAQVALGGEAQSPLRSYLLPFAIAPTYCLSPSVCRSSSLARQRARGRGRIFSTTNWISSKGSKAYRAAVTPKKRAVSAIAREMTGGESRSVMT
jgi:hypothetical protein